MSARPHSNVTIPRPICQRPDLRNAPATRSKPGGSLPAFREGEGPLAPLRSPDMIRCGFKEVSFTLPSTFDDSVLPATSVFCLLTMPEAGRAETPSELRFPVKNSACGAIELFLYTAGTRALPGKSSIQGRAKS